MRKITKLTIFLVVILSSLFCLSCNHDIEEVGGYNAYNHRIINAKTPLKELGYWEATEVEGKENTVTVELSRDVDLLFWTRENGEVLDISRKGLNYIQSFKYLAKDNDCKFQFSEPGVYILNIYQKPNKGENFNLEDVDFRGKVRIGSKAVKLSDNGYADTCKKQALYTISNDSTCYGQGNTMTEFIYVDPLGMKWDSKRRCNYAVYETKFKYVDLNLKVGESITLLLPMDISVNDSRKQSAILKPVQKNGKTFYYIHTTGVPSSHNRVTRLGHRQGSSNGMLTYVNDNRFEMPWKMQ